MKAFLKRTLPTSLVRHGKDARAKVRRLQERARVAQEFRRDGKRYLRAMLVSDGLVHSGLRGANLEAQLTKDYHRIEKGLTLPAPRRPFGSAVRGRIDLLHSSAPGDGSYSGHVSSAMSALNTWNEGGPISDLIAPVRNSRERGIADVFSFFHTRHSTRNFSSEPVSQDFLDDAVSLAINTPSVCNRQAWRIRYFKGASAQEILQHQNGNTGFGHTVPVVALVSVDLGFFAGPTERNQAWIDGGLFSMSLVWAFHGLGLDSCMLNLSLSNTSIEDLRDAAGMSDAEVPIMMIAVGHGEGGHRRARSPRRELGEVRLSAPGPKDS